MIGKAKRSFEVVRSALASEVTGGAEIPLGKKLKMWRSGFKRSSYMLFELHRNDPREYVSDLDISRARGINGAFGRILKDKLLFEPMLRPFVRVPEVLAVVERGKLYPIHRETQFEGLRGLLASCGAQGVIFKPSQGNKGRGVFSVAVSGAQPLVNAQEVAWAALEARLASLDGYLVCRRVQQAEYAARIFPGATNTLRVVTMQDPDTEEVFIPAAIHRFGARGTEPTDNFQTGGLSAPVDLESGRLGRAVRYPTFTGGRLERLAFHPDTREPIEGVVVPEWARVKETVVGLVEANRFLKYVGWDVVLTPEGVCVIEGNHNINLGLQVHGPLLRDPRVRRFFEYHGVIGGKKRPF